jgi:hypothetical protein
MLGVADKSFAMSQLTSFLDNLASVATGRLIWSRRTIPIAPFTFSQAVIHMWSGILRRRAARRLHRNQPQKMDTARHVPGGENAIVGCDR